MAKDIRLPQLGQTMEEGTIVNCLPSIGDEVKKGDVIFEVETDKATLEMESSTDGFVKAILVEAGETVPVEAPLMVLGDKDEEISQDYLSNLKGSDDTDISDSSEAAISPPPIAVSSCSDIKLPSDARLVELPQLGQTMEEGTIVSCLATVGSEVKKGDVIFEVETDKATLEMECPADGFVKAILVEAGETVPVDSAVMVIAGKDTELTADMIASVKGSVSTPEPKSVATPAPAPIATPVPTPQATPTPAPAKSDSGRIFASPRAKTKAKSLGINLATIAGSGTKGRIVEADVVKASATTGAVEADTIEMPTPAYNLGDTVKISRIHKLTADKMLQSKQTIPCFYLNAIVDMTKLVKLRASTNSRNGTKISFNDFIIRAMGLAIKQFPIMAGQVAGDVIKVADNINIGLAIAVGDDLVAPVVKNGDKNGAADVSVQVKDLIAKAKSGKLAPDDLAGGCCTLSNLGAFGIDSFIPIVIPGQCSIVGVGSINDTLVPDNGGIAVRKKMAMTISVDHKVANGAYAAQCLDYMKKLLEKPESLI